MSDQQEYPEAWGVIAPGGDGGVTWFKIADDRESAEDVAERFATWHAVKLIPAPTVDRLVREAEQRGLQFGIEQERQRCRRACYRHIDGTAQQIAKEIESGEQPGERGE